MKYKDLKKYTFVVVSALFLASCEDMIEIDPPTNALSVDETYSSVEGIRTAATGLYSGTIHANAYYYQIPSIYYNWLADDMTYYRPQSYADWIENSYTEKTSYVQTMWTQLYKQVFQDNDFIEHVKNTKLIDEEERNGYIGEALWMRSFDYFWLVNTWGDVPLVLSNNYAVSSVQGRNAVSEVYDQMIADLKTSIDYLKNAKSNTRITSDASRALLSRCYLYTEQWQEAADMATQLIPTTDGGKGTNYQLETPEKVFLDTSKESIFAADMSGFSGSGTYEGYTREGVLFAPTSGYGVYILTDDLVEFLHRDTTDLRQCWIGEVNNQKGGTDFYPAKYKNYSDVTVKANGFKENFIYLRLAEQYLIRAEAYAHLNKLDKALQDLNAIRKRSGVAPYEGTYTQQEVLDLVADERRIELFAEQGHRFFDLKRTGRIDDVLSKCSWKKWKSEKALLPIPYTEMENNRNLTQNPGYNN